MPIISLLHIHFAFILFGYKDAIFACVIDKHRKTSNSAIKREN